VNRWRKWRRRLLWLACGLVVVLLVFWGTMTALMRHWVAKPPVLAAEPAITSLVPETRGDRLYVGRNWFGQREGLPVLYLTGTPFEMGYANGVLTQKLIHRQEDVIVQLLHRVAPHRWTQVLIEFLVTYKNRHMAAHVIPELQMEMLGLTRGCPDAHPEMGPAFNRVLNYHGAQDISYMLMNSPLIRRGCTAFGAWGPRTHDGHLLTGRNFDWEADPVFDADRIVIICEPQDGIPFISLAWAGMAGCVSGMNRAGVSVTVNGAPSHLPQDAGTPTCLVAREVLQHAHNLAEATEIIRKRQVFVSAQFLVGSRQDGRFVVIEKTPELMAVREPEAGTNMLVCANHYLTAELKDDPINEEFKRVDTSVPRFDRMTELLRQAGAPLDATACAVMLRDRRLPGGQIAGNGHRSSLNPLIATHSVLMDLTAGIFWAAKPPHQLGQYVAFEINHPEKLLPEQTVAADPMLGNGEYQRYLASREKLVEGRQALKKGELEAAAECAQAAEKDNPAFYQNSWLLAEALFREGKCPEAAAACRQALDGKPALAGERRRIEQLASEVNSQK
jgi:hypothetical protein